MEIPPGPMVNVKKYDTLNFLGIQVGKKQQR